MKMEQQYTVIEDIRRIYLKDINNIIVDYAVVDNLNFKYLDKYNWHKNGDGYAARIRCYPNKQITISMAIQIMKIMGKWKKGKEIDHINRNKLDNRLCNLRMATRAENNRNVGLRKDNTSKYKGVSIATNCHIKKWLAQIQFNKKKMYIGRYETAKEAAKAYDRKAKEYFGEFARLNFE